MNRYIEKLNLLIFKFLQLNTFNVSLKNIVNKYIFKYNIVIFRNRNRKNNINIVGKYNTVDINSISINNNISIYGNNNKIYIGEGVLNNCQIIIRGDNCNLKIKKNREITNSKFIILDNKSQIFIDNGTGIGGARIVTAGGKNVNIGQNCMISDNVEIWASDTHSIIDLENNQRINLDKTVNIGNNVWIGSGVKILKGVNIENQSIVGMGSIVVNNVKSKTISVGCPNKEIRSNISWCIDRVN